MPRHAIAESLLPKLSEAYLSGESALSLARHLGVTTATVIRFFRRHGIETRGPKPKWTPPVFRCEWCKAEFSPKYNLGKKKLAYCSKVCMSSTWTKESLEAAVRECIRKAGRYQSHDELIVALKTSSATFKRHGLSTLAINQEEGFRPLSGVSLFESRVCECLFGMFGEDAVARQKRFNGLRSPKNGVLRFDFFVEDRNLLIEADGRQHDDGFNFLWPYDPEYARRCDEVKNAYAKTHGLALVRIKYKPAADLADYVRSCLISAGVELSFPRQISPP